MSAPCRKTQQRLEQHRQAERRARLRVVAACGAVEEQGVPVVYVTRILALCERTARRWRRAGSALPLAARGRPPWPASRDERNTVYRFLRERGAETPLDALRAAFRDLRRAELQNLLVRYRRLQRRKAQRRQSRLEWRQAGTVWAADFKERREPIEGRYGWILAVKDLASRYQLAWLPVEEATAEIVQATYARLFAKHGPPLVLKTDNGGPFQADSTKRLLADQGVTPLFSPRRRPSYNGGVERANAQLAGYQEALAEFRGRPGMPTREDARSAQRLANELARPDGWRGATASELWRSRQPLTALQRTDFLVAVAERRAAVRAQFNFGPEESLNHYAQAAVDRRAVRDVLVAQDLLRIQPRRPKRGAMAARDSEKSSLAPAQPACCAGTIQLVRAAAPSMVDGAPAPATRKIPWGQTQIEEATSSTNKSSASGQD
jgi:transposase InsO family protein